MDWNSIGTGAIGTGLNVLGSWATSAIKKEHQKELMQYQNDWNLEMWNRQNEYNSPIQQMARYQQAGLNPNLIYSQGSPGNSQSMPTAATGTPIAPEFGNVGSSMVDKFMQSELQSHQIALLDAQAVKEQALAREAASNADLNVQEFSKRGWTNSLEITGLQLKNDYQKSFNDYWDQISSNLVDQSYWEAQTSYADWVKAVNYLDKVMPIENSMKQLELAIGQYNFTVLAPAQLRLLNAQTADFFASIGLKASQISEITTMISKLGLDMEIGQIEKQLKSRIAQWHLDNPTQSQIVTWLEQYCGALGKLLGGSGTFGVSKVVK